MQNPAAQVIEKCGGPQVVAEILGVDVSRVHRWTYPKERGGSDGIIPTRHQQRLLDEARSRGIELEPADFFEPSDGKPAMQEAS
jgi:hypothetical protein